MMLLDVEATPSTQLSGNHNNLSYQIIIMKALPKDRCVATRNYLKKILGVRLRATPHLP